MKGEKAQEFAALLLTFAQVDSRSRLRFIHQDSLRNDFDRNNGPIRKTVFQQ